MIEHNQKEKEIKIKLIIPIDVIYVEKKICLYCVYQN